MASYAYLCKKAGIPAPGAAAAELGRLGGVARAAALSPNRRSSIAKKAAAVRWEHPVSDPPRYALFFLPEIINEPAETRLVGFRNGRDRYWLESISADYAALEPTRLTTFFPFHP